MSRQQTHNTIGYRFSLNPGYTPCGINCIYKWITKLMEYRPRKRLRGFFIRCSRAGGGFYKRYFLSSALEAFFMQFHWNGIFRGTKIRKQKTKNRKQKTKNLGSVLQHRHFIKAMISDLHTTLSGNFFARMQGNRLPIIDKNANIFPRPECIHR